MKTSLMYETLMAHARMKFFWQKWNAPNSCDWNEPVNCCCQIMVMFTLTW